MPPKPPEWRCASSIVIQSHVHSTVSSAEVACRLSASAAAWLHGGNYHDHERAGRGQGYVGRAGGSQRSIASGAPVGRDHRDGRSATSVRPVGSSEEKYLPARHQVAAKRDTGAPRLRSRVTCVVDASAVVAALVDDGLDGRWAASVMSERDLHAPRVMPVEVVNVLRRASSARSVGDAAASLAFEDLLNLRVTLYPSRHWRSAYGSCESTSPHTTPGTSRWPKR